MMAVLILMLFPLAGVFYLFVRECKRVQQLRCENIRLQADYDEAMAFIRNDARRQQALVELIEDRFNAALQFFGTLHRMLTKLPEYRHGNREKMHYGNKIRKGIIGLIEDDIMPDSNIASDPLYQLAKDNQLFAADWLEVRQK
ncbi:hypothetical protein IIK97_004083 [Salmonella enterica subsp. enterica serovar Nigeria]|nr:hypothetical protein [Salmonella enterica subsp. enterica serovar Nigeria]